MIYVSDETIEERAYLDHAPLLTSGYSVEPDYTPDPITLRIITRKPNERFNRTCPTAIPPSTWHTYSPRAYCACGAFWFDTYHDEPDSFTQPGPRPCRIIETAEVMYSRKAGAIYGISECGELVLWMD